MNEIVIVCICCLFIIGCVIGITSATVRGLQRTVDKQNDTIQRLSNRGYGIVEEVNIKHHKPIKEHYAAWGAQMVNLDEEETHS